MFLRFMINMLHPFVLQLALIILKIVCLLVAIAYYTIAERKIMAAIQRRRGPNVVGFWGLLQPLADGLKLIAKEMVIPSHSNSRIFVIAPLSVLTLSLLSWSIVPFGCFDYTEHATLLSVLDTLYSNSSVSSNVDSSLFSSLEPREAIIPTGGDSGRSKSIWQSSFWTSPVLYCGLIIGSVAFGVYMTYQPGKFGPSVDGLGRVIGTKGSCRNYLCDDPNCAERESSMFSMLVEINKVSDVRYGLLVILALSSLSVYGLIIAGWASSSKYSFLGALRSAAQMISYEVSISLIIIPVIFMAGSLNFTEIVMAQTGTIMFLLPLLPLSIIFFISMIAETNRTPFDLPEAEAELVAGYNVEYSSIIFAMFFLAEYGNMILMSTIKSELFIGGWGRCEVLPPAAIVSLKALIFCFAFVLVRATFPRYRYDQLMDIGWKIFLPVSTGLLILVVGTVMGYNALPVVTELNFSNYSEPHLS
jgi:NADH:ubiquinone oxidoreductase subunit H